MRGITLLDISTLVELPGTRRHRPYSVLHGTRCTPPPLLPPSYGTYHAENTIFVILARLTVHGKMHGTKRVRHPMPRLFLPFLFFVGFSCFYRRLWRWSGSLTQISVKNRLYGSIQEWIKAEIADQRAERGMLERAAYAWTKKREKTRVFSSRLVLGMGRTSCVQWAPYHRKNHTQVAQNIVDDNDDDFDRVIHRPELPSINYPPNSRLPDLFKTLQMFREIHLPRFAGFPSNRCFNLSGKIDGLSLG